MDILRMVEAVICGLHQPELAFNDGMRGVADVYELLSGPIFEPLQESAYFARGELDHVCGTVSWPNGANFAPEALRTILQPTCASIRS